MNEMKLMEGNKSNQHLKYIFFFLSSKSPVYFTPQVSCGKQDLSKKSYLE